jgi:hypothetical protein
MSGSLRPQYAYMFIPDDMRLRRWAFGIAEQRRHSLRTPDVQDGASEDERLAWPAARVSEASRHAEGEQLSLFAPISAIALDETGQPLAARHLDDPPGADARPDGAGDIPGLVRDDDGPPARPLPVMEPALTLEVPPPASDPGPTSTGSPRNRRRTLREDNNARVRTLVHLTGKGHADVNGGVSA